MIRVSRVRLALVVCGVGVLAALSANSAIARPETSKALVGLWEGVDTLDGSTMRVSIGDLEGEKVLEFRWHESFFIGCFDEGIASGRGLISGRVERLNANAIQLIATRFVCFDEGNNEVEIDTFSVDLTYSQNEDTLTSRTTDEFPGFILYRTGSKGK